MGIKPWNKSNTLLALPHPPPSLPLEGGGVCRDEYPHPHDMSLQERNTTLTKSLNPRLRTAENQGMHVVRTFVGIDHFQIHHVADDTELI